LRIISGTHKGRLIKPPAGLKVRPTTDLARESLFNILNNIIDLAELKVLDLFAGTGSISYEFASRGAQTVHAVEVKPAHAAFISKTARKINMPGLKVFRCDVRKFLSRPAENYDIIFADPPYKLDWLADIPLLVLDSGCLIPGGMFILEHPRDYNFSANRLFTGQRKYGSVNFSFFSIPAGHTE